MAALKSRRTHRVTMKKGASVIGKHAVKMKKGAVARRKAKKGTKIIGRQVYVLDVNSADFGDRLTRVFRKNVRKARKANKRLLGVEDLAPDAH